ncbi:MAG: preprotein translocase subunit SecE [Pseudomonadota bacterium]
MNAKAETPSSSLDVVKWLIAAAIVAGGVYGFYYFEGQAFTWLRMLGVVAAVAVAGVVAAGTDKGRAFVQFMKAANIERQKVVWPKRQETMQTTIVVLIVVVVVGIMIWVIDWIFSQMISLLVG